jgi:hypothetical protein
MAGVAGAVDIGVTSKKLIVVDKLSAASKAKVVYVSKDQAAGITKGSATDVDTISVEFSATSGSALGSFTLPAGASDGTSGWLVNKTTVAKYVNKLAPAGPSEAKVAVIKPDKLLKIVGRGLGDVPFDILNAGAPAGSVSTSYDVTNGGLLFRHCSAFTGCSYKLIAGDTGAKLVCKDGAAAACTPPSTVSTTTTSTSTSTTTTLSACGMSAYPICGGPCPAGEVCSPFLTPPSPFPPFTEEGCAGAPPTSCGGPGFGVCPPGFTCALVPPGSYLCAPVFCVGGSAFPTCGGACPYAGTSCQALRIADLPFDTCLCGPAEPCDASCGGYECPVGEACVTDLTLSSCGCSVP